MYVIGYRLDEFVEEGDGPGNVGLVLEPSKNELRGPVDRDEQVELAFLRCGPRPGQSGSNRLGRP